MKVHPIVPCLSLTVTGAAPVPSPTLKVTKRQSDAGKSDGDITCVGLNNTTVDVNEQLQQTTELANASFDIFCHLYHKIV
jgi:hypothetical protein